MATTTTRRTAAAPILLLVVAVVQAASDTENATTHLSFFMHDITSGTSPTAVKVIKGPGTTQTAPTLGMTFGDTTVIDDPLTTTSSPTSPELGRMQGIYMLASQSGSPSLMVCANLLITSGKHNGSTLAVLGRDDTGLAAREIPVVGGTGTFRMASGYVIWKTPEGLNGTDATVQLDVYVTTDGDGGGDALAPAPGGAGGDDAAGGGGGGSSGGSSKSSSGAAARRRGMAAGGWVVAVVVAVVGSSWVW